MSIIDYLVRLKREKRWSSFKLQYIAFLLQQKGADIDYDFEFLHYSVCSLELASAIDRMEEKAYVTKESYKLSEPERRMFDLSDEVLDTVSTAIHLHAMGRNPPEIADSLRRLKPHLQEHFVEAIRIARDLFNLDLSEYILEPKPIQADLLAQRQPQPAPVTVVSEPPEMLAEVKTQWGY